MAERLKIAHDALAMVGYGNEPAVLVVADSEAASERARAAVEDNGGRVPAMIGIAEGAERIDQQAALAAVWLEIESDHGGALDRLLDRLDLASAAGRLRSIVCAPFELVDRIAPLLSNPAIEHLCEPTELDRRNAMLPVLAPRTARVSDIGRNGSRLLQISEEVGRIANVLAELSEEEGAQASDTLDAPVSAGTIRAIIRGRRMRDRFFGTGLFADPAWDMLLDLMAARLEGRRVAVSSLCIAAAVPPTTALRWIKTLTEGGLFARAADPDDGRRVYVELTEPTATAFEGYLRAVPRQVNLAI